MSVLDLAEDFLVFSAVPIASSALPLLSAVVPVVACVAAAVAGANYLRVSFWGFFYKETLYVQGLISAPLQTITNVAVSFCCLDKILQGQRSRSIPQLTGSVTVGCSQKAARELVVPSNQDQFYLSFFSSSKGASPGTSLLAQALYSVNCSARGVFQQLLVRNSDDSKQQSVSQRLLLPSRENCKAVQVFAIDVSDDEEDDVCALMWPASVADYRSPLHDDGVGKEQSALASIGLDDTCPGLVRQLLPDSFLLQFGAMIGEEPCVQELEARGLSWGWGQNTLFGLPDTPLTNATPWELIVDDQAPLLRYKAWRRPLRRGFHMYLSSTVLDGVTTMELKEFNLNNRTRFLWDETAMVLEELEPHVPGCYSGLQQYRCRYPTPMAAREYVYARRVWHRSDGGCYCVSRNCDGANLAKVGGRVCRVSDYVSCFLVRAAQSKTGHPKGAAVVISVYFEDPSMQPGLTNLAIRKGLFGFVQKHASCLREYFACHDGVALGLQGTSREAGCVQEGRARALGARPMSRQRGMGSRRWKHRLLIMFMLKLVHSTLIK